MPRFAWRTSNIGHPITGLVKVIVSDYRYFLRVISAAKR